MKLFIYQHCPFCARARMAFGLKNIPFEQQVVLEGDAETLLSRVGKKVVPILQKDDGSFMTESLDIVRYLDEQVQPASFAAAVPAIEQWCEQAWPLLLKLCIPRFTRAHFAELATDAARQAYIRREQAAFGDLDALLRETPTLLQALQPGLDELETLLAQERPSGFSDFRLYPMLRMLSIVRDVHLGPLTLGYMNRMAYRSGVPLHFDQAI